jgi:hypothetical protein
VIASALAGGFLGTLVLASVLRTASELGATRMDLPFLLGTAVSDDRRRAKIWGYLLHFLMGLVFALIYAACFKAIGRTGAFLGSLMGAVHALFTSTVLVNVLLPLVHPRIGTSETAANQTALIESPGFLMLNYGRSTALVNLAAHVAYGAIVGWAVRL